MDYLNRTELVGRLTADPIDRATSRGTPMATFSLAIDREAVGANGGTQKFTDFVPVKCWDRLATTALELSKGSLVYVVGRVTTGSWEGRDGRKQFKTEVVATSLEPLELRTPTQAEVTF